MRILTALLALAAGAIAAAQPAPPAASPFIVEPYLQLGDVPMLSQVETVRVLWQAPNEPAAKWAVDRIVVTKPARAR